MWGYGDCREGRPGTPSSPGDLGGHVRGGCVIFCSCTWKEVKDELGFGEEFDA